MSVCSAARHQVGPTPTLQFPFPEPPDFGDPIEVAPGILWLRLALPFRLDHIDVYLLEDGPGWAVVDTGIANDETRVIWTKLLPKPITRVIVTHYHPDHVGMAGWLCEQTGARLHMSETEYLASLVLHLNPEILETEPYESFYLEHGLAPAITEQLLSQGHRYLRMLSRLPRTFRRMIAGEVLGIGGRRWEVLTGGGHSPEQVMLHCAEDRILLAADQIMARISPNVSVQPMDPAGDPLGIYIRSLKSLKETIAENTLVLPGHNLPFYGLQIRAEELLQHHDARCGAIEGACRRRGCSAAELVPIVFKRPIDDPHQMGFAFSETLAHVNYLERQGRLLLRHGRYWSS